MTRKKVKLVWIANDSARKASLKKRRVGLLKKVSELTTLCDVGACAIIYSPGEVQPAVWPSLTGVQEMLSRFLSMPEMERGKKMMNQETYLKERAGKVQEQMRKNRKNNKETEMANLMTQIQHGRSLDELNLSELYGLTWLVEEKMKDIRKRLDFGTQVNPLPPGPIQSFSLPPPPAPAPPPPPPPPSAPPQGQFLSDMGVSGVGFAGGDEKNPTESYVADQWFIDMMNNSDNHAGGSSSCMGLQNHPYAGNSTPVAADMGLTPLGNFRVTTVPTDMGFSPYGSYRTQAVPTDHMGMAPQGNFSMGGTGFAGTEMGMAPALQPHENMGGMEGGSGTFASDIGLPFGFIGTSNTGGGDMGLPYDINKTWEDNFST